MLLLPPASVQSFLFSLSRIPRNQYIALNHPTGCTDGLKSFCIIRSFVAFFPCVVAWIGYSADGDGQRRGLERWQARR